MRVGLTREPSPNLIIVVFPGIKKNLKRKYYLKALGSLAQYNGPYIQVYVS